MINFDTYRTLYAEAREYNDIDRYIMERGWQGWMDGMDADQIADLLRAVYTISRDGIHGMLAVDSTSTLRAFCKRYCIKYSTAQKWKQGDIMPPADRLLHVGHSVISNR